MSDDVEIRRLNRELYQALESAISIIDMQVMLFKIKKGASYKENMDYYNELILRAKAKS